VDQSLEHKYFDLKSMPVWSFNPYFSGSVTGTEVSTLELSPPVIVSILILVDQSLEQSWLNPQLPRLHCFNPYFSGSVTGTL